MEKSVRRQKTVTACAVAALLLALAVCLLPWPTRINLTMYGGGLDENGQLVKETSFTLKGWKFDYLFREDTVKLELRFRQGYDPLFVVPTVFKEIGELPGAEDYYRLNFSGCSPRGAEHFYSGNLYLSKSPDKCIFIGRLPEPCATIVACTNENYRVEELIQIRKELPIRWP